MSAHSARLPYVREFDFKMKFYAGLNYKDLWGFGDVFGSAAGLDFTDWAAPAFLSNPNYGFTEVTSYFGALAIVEQQQGALGRWSVELQGFGYDPLLLMRERTFLCTMSVRYKHGGTVYDWTPFGLGFIGAIKAVSPDATHQQGGPFRLTVEGVGHFMDLKSLAPRAYGKVNIAQGRPCTWSSILADPSTLYSKGEFIGTQVSLAPENTTDGVVYGPPSVSGLPPTSANFLNQRGLPNSDHCYIHEVYLLPPTGYGPEYQWFSVSATTYKVLTLGQGDFLADNGNPDGSIPCYFHTFTPFPASPSSSDTEALGIFCYSRARVEELFDLSGAAWVVEWGKVPELANYYLPTNQGYIIAVNGGLIGGKPAPTIHHPIDDAFVYSTNPAWFPPDPLRAGAECTDNYTTLRNSWVGVPFDPTPLQPGEAITRRRYDAGNSRWVINEDTDSVTDWSITDVPTPAVSQVADTPEWCQVDLGDIQCPLKDPFDPTGTYPKTMTLDTTYGLAASGSGSVANQVFTYDSKTATTLNVTAWAGTLAVVGSGNAVYQYDTVTLSVKPGWRVSQIRAWRKPLLSHLSDGRLFASRYTGTLRGPVPEDPEDTWWLDWTALGDPKNGLVLQPPQAIVDSGLLEINLPFDPANPEKHRYTQIMLLAYWMQGNTHAVPATDPRYTANGGYFMLNELEVFADELTTATDGGLPRFPYEDLTGKETLPQATMGTLLAHLIATELGLPAHKIAVSPYVTQFVSNQVTARGSMTNVLGSLCRDYGLVLREALDGTLHVEVSPWWPAGLDTHPIQFFFDRATLCDASEQYGHMHGVSQARISARDAEGKLAFIGTYPASPALYGEVVGEDGTVYISPNQAHANLLAESVFKQAEYNLHAQFTCVGPIPWLRPFQVVSVVWPYEDAAITERWPWWLVTRVEQRFDLGNPIYGTPSTKNWATTFQAQAFDYTVYQPGGPR